MGDWGRSIRWLAAVAALGATGVILAPSAGAQDASAPASRCLSAHPPDVVKVTPTSARVTYEYHDDCWFPAKSWLQVKTGGQSYRAGEIFTKSTGDGWKTHTVELSNLKTGASFNLASGVDYFGGLGESSPVFFDTAYEPATHVRFRVLGSPGRPDVRGSASVHIEVDAASFPQLRGHELSPYGDITVSIFMVVNGKSENPVTLGLHACFTERELHKPSNNWFTCEWRGDLNGFDPTMSLRMQARIENTSYAGSFPGATLHTKLIEFKAGDGGDHVVTGTL